MPQKDTLDNLRTPVCFRILSSSVTSVSIFSVSCYSIVSISVSAIHWCTCTERSTVQRVRAEREVQFTAARAGEKYYAGVNMQEEKYSARVNVHECTGSENCLNTVGME